MAHLPLSRPALTGKEETYIAEALHSGKQSGDGPFTKKARAFLEERLGGGPVLLTTSCTTALELAALLAHPGEGFAGEPEVLIPSFTFVSTANAFLLHGWKPVFVDVELATGNIDAAALERHLTKNTKAICPVHYAGVSADMEAINAFARAHNLVVVEDAAQAIFSQRGGRYAGTVGDLGCFSFHDTKNLGCGEGGALVVNNASYRQRAEILREKGTNRAQFLMGHIDKYTWVDVGGSFLPSDLLAAFLLAQLEGHAPIAAKRRAHYDRYAAAFADLEKRGKVRLQAVPKDAVGNQHIFYIVLPNLEARTTVMKALNADGIGAAFHYPALHLTPMGRRVHGDRGPLPNAEHLADALLRLPLYADMTTADVDRVVERVHALLK